MKMPQIKEVLPETHLQVFALNFQQERRGSTLSVRRRLITIRLEAGCMSEAEIRRLKFEILTTEGMFFQVVN